MPKTGFRLEAIRPGTGKARDIYQRNIRKVLETVAKQVQRDFKDTVKTWDGKPEFYIAVTTVRGRLGITAGTDNVIFQYVNDGTRPHVIRPKRAKALSFQWGGPGSYQAKTKPGRIVSRQGGVVNGTQVKFQQVNHPGFPGRQFDVTIARRRQRSIQSLLERAMALSTREVNTNRRKGQR